MKISTRNQLAGKVKSIQRGAVNDEIIISVSPTLEIVAIITEGSTNSLQLAEGSDVVALIKASSIVLITGTEDLIFSTRNQLSGTVVAAGKGAVNAEVVIDAGDGVRVSAIITNKSFDHLGIAIGTSVTAIFKASSVIVAVRA
uniref:TOBE domain-containing protein n=1 Tax=Castellaniella defragrans TaxID=75697 RepID=UPI003340BFD3